jgi:hypothetical protein
MGWTRNGTSGCFGWGLLVGNCSFVWGANTDCGLRGGVVGGAFGGSLVAFHDRVEFVVVVVVVVVVVDDDWRRGRLRFLSQVQKSVIRD